MGEREEKMKTFVHEHIIKHLVLSLRGREKHEYLLFHLEYTLYLVCNVMSFHMCNAEPHFTLKSANSDELPAKGINVCVPS